MNSSIDIIELQKGSKYWNVYRKKNVDRKINLRQFDFDNIHSEDKGDYGTAYLENLDFSNVDLHMSTLRNGMFINCNFDNSSFKWGDLCFAYFSNCSFKNAQLNVSRVGSASFNACNFDGAELDYISAEDTEFLNCSFHNTSFRKAEFIGTNFTGSELNNCDIYGISSWDLILNDTKMNELSVAKDENECLIVDDIEIAQFIYLLVTNEKMRNVIDTMTSKVVLILGRFTKERKYILDYIKKKLRRNGFVPVLFDFDGPSSRNLSETVLCIAGMAKFVIADITSPRSIPQELQVILPNLPSVPVQPIIHDNEQEYGMFNDHRARQSLQELVRYDENNINIVLDEIITKYL